jgi:hypothetical protein
MDEVDFTILAATSVLGDLIDKCPPAEACRDAFDRMSKATVQMCMSTTGFSSSAQGLNSRRRSHAQEDHFNGPNGKSQLRRQSRPQSQRPKPQFDMGLNDLLAPSVPPLTTTPQGYGERERGIKAEFENYATSTTPTPPPPQRSNTAQSQPQSQPSPIDYAISPPLSSLDTSAIDPSLLPSPTSTFNNPTAQYAANPYQELQFPFQSNLDFLQQGNGWDAQLGGGGDMAGLGMGWEGMDHDFSEGGNVDLFDGFFFGGTGNF